MKPHRPFQPSPGVASLKPYAVPRLATPIDLYLDGNEGQPPALAGLVEALNDGELLRRYPSTKILEATIAKRLGLSTEQVIVTAGADDAIYRACTVALAPGRKLLLPVPTFPMLSHYAMLIGAEIDKIEWMTPTYPTQEVLRRIDDHVSAICIVSPNNPTGATASADDVRAVAEAAPHAMILLDCAYEEFADDPLTEVGLEYDNVMVFRTLSKAWGLAGLRVGYALGHSEMIALLRTAGNPYPVSNLSLAAARTLLDDQPSGAAGYLEQVRRERDELTALLERLGAEPLPSQANFVMARFKNSEWVWQGLIGLGISVRRFPGHPILDSYLRITLPGKQVEFERLIHALRSAMRPEAILFDMDGVMADVSQSYRHAIIETAREFGVNVTPGQIEQIKRGGNANNDWEVTHRLLRDAGFEVSFDDVKDTFERICHGSSDQPGLWQNETLIMERTLIEQLGKRFKLGVVTGRPRRDAERFLEQHGMASLFAAIVCMEDAAIKPDPAPVELALHQLGVVTAWLLGDTPDDMVAARGAGVIPVGVAPADSETAAGLIAAGTGRVLPSVNDISEILP